MCICMQVRKKNRNIYTYVNTYTCLRGVDNLIIITF